MRSFEGEKGFECDSEMFDSAGACSYCEDLGKLQLDDNNNNNNNNTNMNTNNNSSNSSYYNDGFEERKRKRPMKRGRDEENTRSFERPEGSSFT